MPIYKVFLAGLSMDFSEEELLHFFRYHFPSVVTVDLVKQKKDRTKNQGSGFMELTDPEDLGDILRQRNFSIGGRGFLVKEYMQGGDLQAFKRNLALRRVFIHNIGPEVTNRDLRDFFGSFVAVEDAYIINQGGAFNSGKRNKRNGYLDKPKKFRYGYLILSYAEEVPAILEERMFDIRDSMVIAEKYDPGRPKMHKDSNHGYMGPNNNNMVDQRWDESHSRYRGNYKTQNPNYFSQKYSEEEDFSEGREDFPQAFHSFHRQRGGHRQAHYQELDQRNINQTLNSNKNLPKITHKLNYQHEGDYYQNGCESFSSDKGSQAAFLTKNKNFCTSKFGPKLANRQMESHEQDLRRTDQGFKREANPQKQSKKSNHEAPHLYNSNRPEQIFGSIMLLQDLDFKMKSSALPQRKPKHYQGLTAERSGDENRIFQNPSQPVANYLSLLGTENENNLYSTKNSSSNWIDSPAQSGREYQKKGSLYCQSHRIKPNWSHSPDIRDVDLPKGLKDLTKNYLISSKVETNHHRRNLEFRKDETKTEKNEN